MTPQTKPIVIRPPASTAPDWAGMTGVVRLTPAAEKIVRQLHKSSGMSIRFIVSEIIVQSENMIDINPDPKQNEQQGSSLATGSPLL